MQAILEISYQNDFYFFLITDKVKRE